MAIDASPFPRNATAGEVQMTPEVQRSRSLPWQARLALHFSRQHSRSVLVRATHEGPLVVQKPLYPEGPEVCQVIVVHPPGGIAGGDALALTIDVRAGAHAQLTTPGATKWYRSAGEPAVQRLDAAVASGAVCEWLPQEAIVFNAARAELATSVALAGDAVFLGWDVVCLGRIASGERFQSGEYRQCYELVRDGALVWAERTILDPRGRFARSPVGLNGYPVFGTFIAAAQAIEDNALATWRAGLPPASEHLECAVTRLPGVLVARCRGDSVEAARAWFVALWALLRPGLCAREAVTPRIWNT